MSSSESEPEGPESGMSSPERFAFALHEVSNALTVVLGWLDMAARAKDPQEAEKALAVAREHARRGQVMARRAIGAAADSDRTCRTAAALAEFAAVSVRPQAAPVNVRILTEIGPGTDCAVDADGPALQILTNLLLNAIAFSREGSAIEVTAKRADEEVLFIIQDDGPGISQERQSGLFTAPLSTRPGGAGIGLPHSRDLARQCGGELTYVPSAVGARFELAWPIAQASGTRPSVRAGTSTVLDAARVLVLEDDAAISTLIELSFEARGAEVIVVSGTEQLCSVLDGRPVLDVVLLDLSPIHGDLVSVLNRFDPQVQIVLMSGQPDGVPEEAAGRFATWVRKPFDMEQLIESVSGLLAKRG